MPKLRFSGRDCGWFDGSEGLPIGLCWVRCDGPEVVRPAECSGCEWFHEPHEGGPRALWRWYHGHDEQALAEIVVLLRLAGSDANSVRVVGGMLSSFRASNRIQIEGARYPLGKALGDVLPTDGHVMEFDLLRRLRMVDEDNGGVRSGRLWFVPADDRGHAPERNEDG